MGLVRTLAVTLLASTPLQCAAQAAGPALDLRGYHISFDEAFDRLDATPRGPSRWTTHTWWNGDFGEAQFSDPGPGGPFTVRDGVLSITARRDPDGHWRSGLIASIDPSGRGFAQKYGYFEIRAKLPKGRGVWPAFWLGETGGKETSVEIDVFEFYGHAPNAFGSSVHLWRKHGESPSRTQVTYVEPGSLNDQFHTYGVLVSPKTITIYLDRRAVQVFTTPPELHDSFGVLADLALGGGWPIDRTPDPSVMQIDYIRVYAPDGPLSPSAR